MLQFDFEWLFRHSVFSQCLLESWNIAGGDRADYFLTSTDHGDLARRCPRQFVRNLFIDFIADSQRSQQRLVCRRAEIDGSEEHFIKMAGGKPPLPRLSPGVFLSQYLCLLRRQTRRAGMETDNVICIVHQSKQIAAGEPEQVA